MKKALKISIIGSGNVATHFGTILKNGGHQIVDICSRNAAHAKKLAVKIGARPITDISNIDRASEFIIIAVADDAIASVVTSIKLKNCIVLHTSGATNISVLTSYFTNAGVVYPLQTLSSTRKLDAKKLPLLLEASNKKSEEICKKMFSPLFGTIHGVSSDQRLAFHVAAVFACNFTNHMYAVAYDVLKDKQLNFNLLFPLMQETLEKAVTRNPHEMQTGPAHRGDKQTIKKHLAFLKDNKKFVKYYKILSKGIAAKKRNK